MKVLDRDIQLMQNYWYGLLLMHHIMFKKHQFIYLAMMAKLSHLLELGITIDRIRKSSFKDIKECFEIMNCWLVISIITIDLMTSIVHVNIKKYPKYSKIADNLFDSRIWTKPNQIQHLDFR